MSHREWDPAEVQRALDTELAVHDELDHRDVAKRKFKDSAALAADRVLHIALYSESESLALKASTYILDRVFGRVTDAPMGYKGDETLESILREVHGASSN